MVGAAATRAVYAPDVPEATTPILLTRPRADSERFARMLGLPCTIAPLSEVAFVAPAPRAEALLLTSGNAVAAWVAGGGALGLPAWCVGERTAALAAEAGLDVRGWAPDAAALAAMMPCTAPPLVHARGAQVRGDLAGRLRARGLVVSEAVLYEARALPFASAARRLALAGPVLAPVFSPRGAALLGAAWPPGASGHLRAVALSDAVADALPVTAVAVAERPDARAMVAAVRGAIGS